MTVSAMSFFSSVDITQGNNQSRVHHYNWVLAPFAAVKGRTIKFQRRQEYVHGEVYETVAGVANLQVAVEKD